MKFCIATVAFWHAVGFDTEYWRKSADGLKAICHDKFARSLVADVDTNDNIVIYDIDSEEFKQVIADEFTSDEVE